MAKRTRKWIKKSGVPEHKGALHRELGYKKGEKIPTGELLKLQHAPGKLGHRVRWALIARGKLGKHKAFKHHHGPIGHHRRRKTRHAHTR